MKAVPQKKSQRTPTRIVLIDHHASVREMLAAILEMEGGFQVAGQASGGMEGLALCRETKPDLVILDLALPELGGAHLIRLLLREPQPARILVYSGAMDDGLLRDALSEEPHGFVRKEDTLSELRAAVCAVISGARHISPWSARLLPARSDAPSVRLTPQECAVLQMIAEGRQTKEIAEALGASAKTTEHHRQHVMGKLGLHDVASLTRYAVRHRMVSV